MAGNHGVLRFQGAVLRGKVSPEQVRPSNRGGHVLRHAERPGASTIHEFIDGRLDNAGDPDAIAAALSFGRDRYPRVTALREADKQALSPSDIECLDEAIAFCRARGFRALSNLTHQERAWRDAPANGPMDYEAMIDADNPNREAVLQDAREFAAYGVL
jgi:hypothetical protein